MIVNKCFVCGSSNIRADRAFSGKLVCTSCGNPYGVRKGGRYKLNTYNTFSIKKKYWLLFSILILAFILVII